MKKILFLAMLFLASIAANAQTPKELDIYDLDFGDNKPHIEGSVTFIQGWEMAGWSFQDEDGNPTGELAGATDFVLTIEPANFAFQIKVQWSDGTETDNTVNANTQTYRFPLEASTSKDIISISIQDRDAYAGYEDDNDGDPDTYPVDGVRGTIFLESAIVEFNAKTQLTYYQFEGDNVGSNFPSVDLIQDNGVFDMVDGPVVGLEESVASVVATGKSGNGIDVYPGDANHAIRLWISLPEGTTVANVESIIFDIAFPEAYILDPVGFGPNAQGDIYKDIFVVLYDKETGVINMDEINYNKIGSVGGEFTTITTPVTPAMKEGMEDATGFDLFLGANVMQLEDGRLYVIDNVKLVVGGSTEFVAPAEPALSGVAYVNAEEGVTVYTTANGIFVESNGAKTTVFGVDGRVVASTFDNNINLQSGLYIVKVGNTPATKVIVK